MNFIPPLEISSKIMTLIDEAEKELIIVSPYVSIAEWEKMKKCLKAAVGKKINISFYCRENADQDLTPIRKLGIEPILIHNLHAKLYMNESMAVVTSQNMVFYSDTNSLDIGHYTEDIKFIEPLRKFVNKLVSKQQPTIKYIEMKDVNQAGYNDEGVIKENDVLMLLETMKKAFPYVKYTPTSTYIFSENLLNFCDTMIGSDYTIKLQKYNCDYEGISNKLKNLPVNNLNHNFEMLIKSAHKGYFYIDIRAKEPINIMKLAEDYVTLTRSIKNLL
ncbi:hypothetical protein OZ666_13230 [Elizabethkingia sp. HX QKY]|uniref:hypothetical protein n=1 Tax=Elizabethkingia TaxID=308865 RepID=UPI002A23EAFB|nr:hypothetical protein [Elizabethkingia sp. HX QKY]MDX8572648.1 hypothetical protein [Elizabethkingia sp. HX QKY]